MSLSPSQEALIADRLRVWHVRRACQVATLSASTGRPSEDTPRGDAALDALLRCLLYELSGDIAAVTLLDQSTQYFLAVIPRSALHTADVTGSTRQWYGCQSISHGGKPIFFLDGMKARDKVVLHAMCKMLHLSKVIATSLTIMHTPCRWIVCQDYHHAK